MAGVLLHTHCQVRHGVHTPVRSHRVQVVSSAVHPTQDEVGTNLATIPVSQSDRINQETLFKLRHNNLIYNKLDGCKLKEVLDPNWPVQHVLQDADRHDDPGLPAAVQGEDGEVGREHVGGLLGVGSRSRAAAAGDHREGPEGPEAVITGSSAQSR